MFKKLLCLTFVLLCAGCASGPTEYGVPKAQFAKMTPAQKQQTIAEYKQAQQRKAAEDSIWDAVSAVAGEVASEHPSSSEHCHHSQTKKVCHTNADGSVTCTQSGSSSCSGFSVD